METSFFISHVFGPIIMRVARTIVMGVIPGNPASNKRFKARVKRITKRCEIIGLVFIVLFLIFLLYRVVNFSHPITPLTSFDAFKIAFLTYSTAKIFLATVRWILR
jgi:hypothetical protein